MVHAETIENLRTCPPWCRERHAPGDDTHWGPAGEVGPEYLVYLEQDAAAPVVELAGPGFGNTRTFTIAEARQMYVGLALILAAVDDSGYVATNQGQVLTVGVLSLKELRTAYPGWHIRPTWEQESLIATRKSDLTPDEIFAGLAMTLMSGDFGAPMEEQLAEQARIEASMVNTHVGAAQNLGGVGAAPAQHDGDETTS